MSEQADPLPEHDENEDEPAALVQIRQDLPAGSNDDDEAAGQDEPKQEHDDAEPGAAQVVFGIAKDSWHEVWVDDQSTVWADVVIRGRPESVRVDSTQFRRWLRDMLRAAGYPPQRKSDIALAIEEIDSWGAMRGEKYTRHLRVAHHGERVYIDLADDEGQAVEVTENGWKIVNTTPVRFVRGPTTLSLPTPVTGGTVDELRPLVNAPDDAHWMLMAGFLVGAYGRGPFPLLILQGQQARGKSMTMEALRTVVDPDRVTRASRPKGARDLMVAGQKRWIISFDNLSGLSHDLSDALCILATGGAGSERKLYTNSAEVVHGRMAPTMCSGIDDIATRGDLVRRAIILELPRLSNPVPEATMKSRLRDVAARVLGAILDSVSCALRNVDGIEPSSGDVSMADHVAWVEAAAPALGWERGAYTREYEAMHQDAQEREIDRDPVARAINQYVAGQGGLSGTTTEIMDKLDDRFVSKQVRASREWPKGPRAFSEAIRRAAPALRAVGIDADQGSGRGRRTWTIRRL